MFGCLYIPGSVPGPLGNRILRQSRRPDAEHHRLSGPVGPYPVRGDRLPTSPLSVDSQWTTRRPGERFSQTRRQNNCLGIPVSRESEKNYRSFVRECWQVIATWRRPTLPDPTRKVDVLKLIPTWQRPIVRSGVGDCRRFPQCLIF